MTGATTSERLPNSSIEQARHTDLVPLASQYSQLHKASGQEWAGPCPKCGGDDRLHVKADGWFCRQCKPIDPVHGWHDAVDFVRWMQPGLTFLDAIAQLTGGTLPTATQRTPERTQQAARTTTPDWLYKATVTLQAAQARLLETEGELGQEYLIARGLEPRTWLQYGLGYRPDAFVPGTHAQQKAPAIVMPWFAGGKLTAIRYRFLDVQDGHKQTAEMNSVFRDRLFGGQGLPDWVSFANSDGKLEGMCDLVICEGEINAMSIWQVASDTNLHVLSLGSESAKLSDAMVAVAKRYRHVIIWMDRAEVARNLQMAIPAASSITSPGGKDANDLLRDGLLGAVLSMARLRACRNDHEREGLLWDLRDAAHRWLGVDKGTVQVIQKIAGELGKTIQPLPMGLTTYA